MEFNATRSIIKLFVRLGRAYTQRISPIAYIARKFIGNSGDLVGGGNRQGWCLDIGAGVAPYEKEIFKSFNIEKYIPVDVAASDRTKVVANGAFLPFSSETIKLVVSFDVIQHVSDPMGMLREINRVLLPGGYLILTFPFLYPECDYQDFRRWTMDGMEQFLRQQELEIIIMERRGGACFAATCGLTWIVQHLIPGQRSSWRASRSWASIWRTAAIMIMTLPIQLLAWIALLVDRIISTEGIYMGGAIFVQKKTTVDFLEKRA